ALAALSVASCSSSTTNAGAPRTSPTTSATGATTSTAATTSTTAEDTGAPRASAGCNGAGTSVHATANNAKVAFGSRYYLQRIPHVYDGRTPRPLVLDIHGYEEGAEIQAAHSGLGAVGDRYGFVTVFPQGSGIVPNWNTRPGSPDLAFISR